MTIANNDQASASAKLLATIQIATPHDGYRLPLGDAQPVLRKGVNLPAQATCRFTNATAPSSNTDKPPLTVELFFGDNKHKADNISLGEFKLPGIPYAPPGPEKIELKIAVNVNHILSILLVDDGNPRFKSIGFIDISRLEPPPTVSRPESSNDNLQGIDLGDMFGHLFGPQAPGKPPAMRVDLEKLITQVFDPQGPRKKIPVSGENISQELTVSFEEAFAGTRKKIPVLSDTNCPVCEGSGVRPGKHLQQCADCQGTGVKRTEKLDVLGRSVASQTCPTCGGEGQVNPHPCARCQGKAWVQAHRAVTVHIPAGIDYGAVVRTLYQGEPGRNGGLAGHLDVTVAIDNHPIFSRVGRDVCIHLPVSTPRAKTGGQLRVPGPEKGSYFLINLPPGTRNGTTVEVYQCEEYTLTGIIETYHPSLLIMAPDARKRLEAIKRALGDRDYEFMTN